MNHELDGVQLYDAAWKLTKLRWMEIILYSVKDAINLDVEITYLRRR